METGAWPPLGPGDLLPLWGEQRPKHTDRKGAGRSETLKCDKN